MRRALPIFAVLVSLGVPAFSADSGVFPKDFCSTLPALSADDQARLWEKMPDLKDAPARRVPSETAAALLARAVDRGMSALELFTQDAVREDCAFVITGDVIDSLGKSFELFLLTPFSGTSVDGKPFRTAVLVFGRGRLFHFYDRGGFRYKHPFFDDTFTYENVIREQTPEAGRLEIAGVRGPMGLSIESLHMLSPEKVEVRAGVFTVSRPLRKIVRKTPPPVPTVRLPSAARMQAWFEGH